jgi:hypothetical protein
VIKRLLPLVLVVAATLAACGKDEPKPSASGDPITSTTEAGSSTSTTAPAQATTLKATEYAYAGTNLTFTPGQLSVTVENDGKEEHQATIVRFKPGKTIADLQSVAGANPGHLGDVIDVFGGPNAAKPGGGSATSTQSLEPGDYFFMCFIPAPDGVPHAAKGMVAPFKVEGAAPSGETASPASSGNQINLQEYSFGIDKGGISAGSYTVANKGTQLHEAAIYKPAEGKTVQDVIDYFKQRNPSGPPPVDPAGGVAPISPGSSANIDLQSGDYVFICFLPDVADNAPHFSKGMIQEVKVG